MTVTETTLPFPPNVRHSDPATSRASAAVDRTTLTHRAHGALRNHPEGVTDWELVAILGLSDRMKGSVTKRRQECGAVDSGRTRRGEMGHACTVWVLP